jgi:hypothetical protein
LNRLTYVALTITGILFLGLLAPTVSAAGIRDEAERQLTFARDELDAGKFDRALASAESALRLEPSLYDAMVVKALAYEGLGNLRMAEVMLLAYGEIATGLGPNPEVDEALARLQRSLDEASSVTKRGRGVAHAEVRVNDEGADAGVTPEPLAGRGPVEPLDPEPFRERVALGLSEGKCEYARAAALELTASAPDLAGGYRLLGDAARCDSRTREAVLAYRRFKALGGKDSKVDLMLRGLEADLATLVVAVDSEALDSSVPPQVVLHLVTETLTAAPLGDGTVTFADLPVGKTLVVDVSGKGLASTEVNVEPLEPGEERSLRVAPEWIGLGTVSLVDHDSSLCETILLTPDGELVVEPGKERTVTAGQVTAVVANDHGVIEVPLELAADSTLAFDPQPWLPSSLTLIQLPSGSSVRVFVEGIDDALGEAGFDVPIGAGEVDPLTGVRVAPPHKLDSLPGGRAGIFVTHPVLGTGNVSTVLAPAEANASTFDWHVMDGLSTVSAGFERWKTERLAVQRRATGSTVAPALLAIGSGIASGVLWGAGISAGKDVTALKAAATAAEDPSEVGRLGLEHQAAQRRETGLLTGAGVTSGVAVVGGVLTGVFGQRGRRAVVELGEWDPANVDDSE